MICADQDILLLNRRLDKATRRDVFVPTQISGVSVCGNRKLNEDNGDHTEHVDFSIRIPIGAQVQDGRTYLPEAHYDRLKEEELRKHFTLHTDDLLIWCTCRFEDVHTSVFETDAVTMAQAEELARTEGIQKELIHIVEYADNTLRGSDRVKHWRIGGA